MGITQWKKRSGNNEKKIEEDLCQKGQNKST